MCRIILVNRQPRSSTPAIRRPMRLIEPVESALAPSASVQAVLYDCHIRHAVSGLGFNRDEPPRVTVDFSHVIPPAHLDAQVERLKLDQVGRG
jgi:hypothetical protein